MYYLCCKNKGTDQLRGYREADLRLRFRICQTLVFSCRPRLSGLGEIDGLHGTSTQSCILTYDLCTGEPLRRPKPAQDEWYVIMSGHPFIKAVAAYWGGASVQGLRCHFISMPGKSPMKLEVTSRHDHSCLLGCKASKQTKGFLMTRLILRAWFSHHAPHVACSSVGSLSAKMKK